MNKFELNIGMNNNKCTVQQILAKVYESLGQNCIEAFRMDVGEWEGEQEETLVIKGQTEYHLAIIVNHLANEAEEMGQDCIAISSDQYDLLIYNWKFVGDKMKFDKEFFIRYQ